MTSVVLFSAIYYHQREILGAPRVHPYIARAV